MPVLTMYNSADGLLKDDLVLMLGDHLNSNETTYAKHPEFREYYGLTGSPVKRERASPSSTFTVARSTRRRTLMQEPSPAYVQIQFATRQAWLTASAQ
jgi:hypothetical protein